MKKRIILGSASPRRKELLAQIGVEFEVKTSDQEECYKSRLPEEIVQELAVMKAEHVAAEVLKEEGGSMRQDTVIIGADTVVELDGTILGKPKDIQEAVAMLQSLQGRAHRVYTGVAVLSYSTAGDVKKNICAEKTDVFVGDMSEKEIREYAESKDPLDKAGGYGIQGRFAAWIRRIEGDYYNVVGLPVSCVYHMLKEADAL